MTMELPEDLRYRIDRYMDGDLSVTATMPADPDEAEFWLDYAGIEDYRAEWATVTTTHPSIHLEDNQIALAAYSHDRSTIERTIKDLELTEDYTTDLGPFGSEVIVATLPDGWRMHPLVDCDLDDDAMPEVCTVTDMCMAIDGGAGFAR